MRKLDWDYTLSNIGPEPITTDMAKAQTRVDTGADDALINSYIIAAREIVEQQAGMFLRSATATFTFNYWPGRIPTGPVRSVTSIGYTDTEGVDSNIPVEDYRLDTFLGQYNIMLLPGKYWPATSLDTYVRVTAEVGPEDLNGVPETLRLAMLILVAHWYELREPVVMSNLITNVPFSLEMLLGTHKVGVN